MSETEDTTRDRATPEPLVFDARELFQGRTEVFIEYEGVRYRLRITKKRRLLLQK